MDEYHWYAYRVYRNKMNEVKSSVLSSGLDCYVPMRPVLRDSSYCACPADAYTYEPVIPSLIFIRSSASYALRVRRDPGSLLWVYCRPGTDEPSAIPDREMDVFMYVTRTGCMSMESIGLDFVRGDRVRVTGGMFSGAEGYISRVHGTRRFVVVIEGVAAIATVYIPRHFIEKIL